MGGKLSKQVENNGKRRNCSLRAISPFPTVFSKDFTTDTQKAQGLLGKGIMTLVKKDFKTIVEGGENTSTQSHFFSHLQKISVWVR